MSEPKDFDFGEALKLLKMGNKVARLGWRGCKAYIELKNGDDENKPYIRLKTARGLFCPWIPNHCDLLEDDWWMVTD